MTCNEWNDDWIAHLYGELEPDQERAVATHLEKCAACRSTLAELRASHELLQEAAPEIPATPRVVVLRPRPVWPTAWAFAAGAACALLLFGLGFVAGPRWTGAERGAQQVPLQADAVPPAVTEERAVFDEVTPAVAEPTPDFREDLLAIARRVDRLEERPEEEALTPVQLREELDQLERRFQRERVRDLEYVIRSLTASELRTGTWMDRTEEALTLLAMRQDPGLSER
jgi:hypothetical protein